MFVGRFVGLAFAILGALFTALAFSMLTDAGMTLKVFVFGPAVLAIGLAMMIFPGPKTTAAEWRAFSKSVGGDPVQMRRAFWGGSPLLHKVIWTFAGVVGLVVASKVLPL